MEDSSLFNVKSSTLCFKKEDFMVKDFSVDKFVSECRKYASLEAMQEDLGLYHKILCSSMVELINKDYADFVNLSSNLVGLDKSIKSLSSPLHNLKNEITNTKLSLDRTMEIARGMVSERSAIHQTKILIHRIVSILEGLEKIEIHNIVSGTLTEESKQALSLEVLERIALEFNLVQFHMNKISNLEVLECKKEEVKHVAHALQKHLEFMFLMSLSNHDVPSLQKVLRIFSAIDKERQVEACFGRELVKPYMRKVITEELVSKKGLTKVYDTVLAFIPKNCSTILEVTRGAKRNSEIIRGYDFLVNAVWPEIVLSLDYIAAVHIFDIGNPDSFHENYCASMEFLDKFEHSCAVQTSVKRLREHPSYEVFMMKWNMDVYFEIRFQEIARKFESSLLCPLKPSTDKNTPFLLNVTFSLWSCLNLCWTDSVFLMPLSHNFWRLTLQLISRYVNWARNMLTEKEDSNSEKKDKSGNKINELSDLTPGSKQKNQKTVDQHFETDTTKFSLPAAECSVLIKDVETLLPEMNVLLREKILPKLDNALAEPIDEAFNESRRTLYDILPEAGCFIVTLLINQCSPHLKLITDIPRLYRKTNREVPSKPSPYATFLFKPLAAFQRETEQTLSEEWKLYCLKGIINGIMQLCVTKTKEVLTSIKKMEDSLKILKRARDKPSGQCASGTMTDDDKIRRQLVIDVNFFGQQVEKLGLTHEDLRSYAELKDLVSSAERNSGVFKS